MVKRVPAIFGSALDPPEFAAISHDQTHTSQRMIDIDIAVDLSVTY